MSETRIQRTTPLPQKLGEFVAALQKLLENGVSPETVVHVFDPEFSAYHPVSLAAYGGGSLSINLYADEDYDEEIPRWQNAIRDLCITECGKEIDGRGCESGDPLDLTLTEIQLAFNHIKENDIA